MGQLFRPSSNTIAKASIFGVLALVGIGLWLPWQLFRSPYVTRVRVAIEQPIAFSHEHHVGGLGIDCRYCHTSVEQSYFAGMPATKTCMTCHSQIWNTAGMLKPVRESWRTQQAIKREKVHNLPDYAYFNHSAHVTAGVSCVSCHGRVDQMVEVTQVKPLNMAWCLECHRNPAPNLRPAEFVTKLDWEPPAGKTATEIGLEIVKAKAINPPVNCGGCHR